jgi:hypothetical protein
MLVAKALCTIGAGIEPFILIMKLAHMVVQVANAATGSVWLAGNLTIVFKEVVQRLEHVLKILRAGLYSFAT